MTITIDLSEPPRAPVVRPDPAPAAIQAERIRLAGLNRERRALKRSRNPSRMRGESAATSIALPDGKGRQMSQWTDIKRVDDNAERVTKFVFENPSAVAEGVLYRYPTYRERTVICISTQSGCPVGCRFCGAGDAFVRSLTADEIVAQADHCLMVADAAEAVKPAEMGRLQIMFMSMGEPLLNLKGLAPAIRSLYAAYPNAALLISTSAPRADYAAVRALSVEVPTVGLQFSVHESTDAARDELIPFKAKLTLAEIAAEGEAWFAATGRHPFFNYCAHYGSVCSGIEAASGWRAERLASARLAKPPSSPKSRRSPRRPSTPLAGDPACMATSRRSRLATTSQSTFWSEEHLASLSASRVSEADWMTTVATWPSNILGWLTACGPGGWFGRTSPASCRRLEDGTLEPFSGAWSNSGMGSPTECLTLSSSEWPSDAAVCSLSDILETGDVPQRFFLSATACKGILRRAEKRGKEALAQALRATAVQTKTQTS
jgi:hypothetical protein